MQSTLTLEQRLAQAIIGQETASTLMVDAYKFAMAQAGKPLCPETFALVFRRGCPFYNPFDLNAVVQSFRPATLTLKEGAFLTANGYGMTPAMEVALTKPIRVVSAPKGTWVAPNTPAATVSSASFMASWSEHFAIMLHYPLQVATAIRKGERHFVVVCPDEEKIVRIVAEACGVTDVMVDTDTGYMDRVRAHAIAVKQALKGEAHRAFEVGLRAATCIQQHLMVLGVLREVGIHKTSNVYGAWLLYMIPVGTTGHEHQMRWGGETADDRIGYRVIRDTRPEPPSYLFDTTDPIRRGIPRAFEVIAEDPLRPCSMRFDSGDQDVQFLMIKEMSDAYGVYPTLPFEDSYDAEKTIRNEAFCDKHEWPRHLRLYGYGGFLVSRPHPSPYSRDVVSASYKLACTAGQAVQKISGSPGKESIPGKPIVLQVTYPEINKNAVVYVIAQEWEEVDDSMSLPCPLDFIPEKITVLKSEQTCNLINSIHDNIARG